MSWYLEVLRKYVDFSGRARRKEYWMFSLVNCLISVALMGVALAMILLLAKSDSPDFAFLFTLPFALYSFATAIPGLSVTVRRLHDTGRSGWWYFISFVPFAGPLILLIFLCTDSQPGPNLYGPNPKDFPGFGGILPPVPGY